MKLFKKIAAIMLSIMMVLGMASVVSADGTGTTAATGTGAITITNAIPKQTYKIYRILELESHNTTTGNYAYKATSTWKSFIEGSEIQNVYVTIDNDYVTWKEGAKVEDFAQKALKYANDNNLSFDQEATAPDATAGETTSTVTFSGLPLGYYLVDSSVGALCSLNTTNPTATIQEKNGVPSVEKKVSSEQNGTYGQSNSANIGDKVYFQTTITAQQGAQNYVLHDKMDAGLTFDTNSVKVNLKKNNATTERTVDSSNYVVKSSSLEDPNPCTFHVEFTQTFCDTLEANDKIIVTYSATLNENAVIAGNGNTNETWLKYGNSNDTNHDTTTTKTFELPVLKYTMKNSKETALAGAIFTLSKSNDGSNLIELVSVSKDDTTGDIYRVAKTGDAGTVTTVTTTKSGKFTIKGLDADTYYLTETQQPAGYNKLSAPIKVVIAEDGTITVGENTTTVNEVKVENNTGSILPSTGGSGTTLIYILGAVLVLGSSVVLITKKRMR